MGHNFGSLIDQQRTDLKLTMVNALATFPGRGDLLF